MEERTANGLKEINDFVKATWAGEAKQAVVVSDKDLGRALLATSLATLLAAPLFVTPGEVAAADLSQLVPEKATCVPGTLGRWISKCP